MEVNQASSLQSRFLLARIRNSLSRFVPPAPPSPPLQGGEGHSYGMESCQIQNI